MNEQDRKPPGPPDNLWNRWNAHIAMKLAYWAYPHEDEKKASELAEYPPPWKHAKPKEELPSTWHTPVYSSWNHKVPGTPEGWNTQHNADGKLEVQFVVSINKRTNEISFDFKGSDAWSNWVSDLGNAGASEFARIQAQAQAAFDYLSKHPDYKNFHFTATGHSLGGGMAQSFALKNNLDVAVYNSLPIAQDTIQGDYFKDVGGYKAALARYTHTVHDVRTPNDIATYYYQGVWQDQYLSKLTAQAPTQLPGPAVPDLLKTVLVASKAGTLPALALMGKDHTMGSLVEAQGGLSVGPDGRYRIPQGHQDFSEIPLEARKRFALISASPVTQVTQVAQAEKDFPVNSYNVQREDGSHQFISVNTRTGQVEIEHYGADGQRLKIELNAKRGGPATFTELDAEGNTLRSEQVAMGGPAPATAERDTQVAQSPQAGDGPKDGSDPRHHREASAARSERASGDAPAPRRPAEAVVASIDPREQAQFDMARDHSGQRLQRAGLTAEQIDRVCAAAVTHCSRHAAYGDPQLFLVSRDAQRLGVLHENRLLTEMDIAQALNPSVQAPDTNRTPSAELATHRDTAPSAARGGLAA